MPNTSQAIRLSPFYTASTWGTAWQAIFTSALALRGKATAADGTLAPRLTNAEAIALIEGWRAAVAPGVRVTRTDQSDIAAVPWPLWYQFAAVAYGWDDKADQLDTRPEHRARLYPIEMGHELWRATYALAQELDDAKRPHPRIDIDPGAFDDPDTQREVARALREDGAAAMFKIPVGCKNPRMECEERPSPRNGWLGKGCKIKCDPVMVDDPVTVIGSKLSGPLLLLAIIVAAAAFGGAKGRR